MPLDWVVAFVYNDLQYYEHSFTLQIPAREMAKLVYNMRQSRAAGALVTAVFCIRVVEQCTMQREDWPEHGPGKDRQGLEPSNIKEN